MTQDRWYVYMVRCADDSLYTGMAKDIGKRLKEHLARGSECAKYTRSRPVTALEALWQVPDGHTARSLEWHIKRLTREQKLKLIRQPETVTTLAKNAVSLPADLNLYIKKSHLD